MDNIKSCDTNDFPRDLKQHKQLLETEPHEAPLFWTVFTSQTNPCAIQSMLFIYY